MKVKEESSGRKGEPRFTDQSKTAKLHVFHLHIAALSAQGLATLLFSPSCSPFDRRPFPPALRMVSALSPILFFFFFFKFLLLNFYPPLTLSSFSLFLREALTFSCLVAPLLRRRRGLLGLCVSTLTHLHFITVVQWGEESP